MRLEPFCKLADITTYVACDWDLRVDAAGRGHWISFFKRHIETILKLGFEAAVARGEASESATRRVDLCRERFNQRFDAFAARPVADAPVTMLTIDGWRDDILRDHGFVDAFIDLKHRENAKMLPLVPAVCAQLDAMSPDEQVRAIIEGVFAGNIFDMGAEATAKKFLAGSPDFFSVRKSLPARPWLVDDFDALSARVLTGPTHKKVVFFIDNAGSDFLLGAVPMIRWLARRGSEVVIAANERPTLNDMTIDDVRAWWPRVLEVERSLAGLPISLVSTGTGEPLIDLGAVSPELNRASAGADLVIIEGMGRGVESNLDARFDCDALNLAMVKDIAVADRLGGKVFDVVCRFR